MEVSIYTSKDYTKKGDLKKKNNLKIYLKDDFISFIKENNFKVNYGYIDNFGIIENTELKFKCFHNGIIIGVSGICKQIKEGC